MNGQDTKDHYRMNVSTETLFSAVKQFLQDFDSSYEFGVFTTNAPPMVVAVAFQSCATGLYIERQRALGWTIDYDHAAECARDHVPMVVRYCDVSPKIQYTY